MSKSADDPYEEYFTNLNNEPPRIKAGGKRRWSNSAELTPRPRINKNRSNRKRSNNKKKRSGGQFFVKKDGKKSVCTRRDGTLVPGMKVVTIKGREFCARKPARSKAKNEEDLRRRMQGRGFSEKFIDNAVGKFIGRNSKKSKNKIKNSKKNSKKSR